MSVRLADCIAGEPQAAANRDIRGRRSLPASGVCKHPTLAYSEPMPTPEDSALMLRYSEDGDLAAFDMLYARHKDPVYRYLLRHCRRPDAAEDVFQEVWAKIIRSKSSYRPTAKFSTFLYRVAHNCFIDHYRRNKRHQGADEFDDALAASDRHGPADETERQLARRRLDAALSDLPHEQRDAFLLQEEGGLSLDQIATITGCKRETVKSRIRYANQKLRVALGAEEHTV